MSPETMKLLLVGCAGGVIPDLIRFAKSRYDTSIADYFKHWNFWLGLLVLVALGGLAVVFGDPATTTQALALGYAARNFSRGSSLSNQPNALRRESSSPRRSACDAGGRSKKVDRGVMTSSRPT